MILWIQFDSSYIGYQFVTEASPEFLKLNLGVDGISLFFVLLTTFITPIALLSSHNDIEKNLKFYLVSILLLETLQIAVFVVLDLLLFYIFFESVLIPLFFIVGVWGASAAKVRAAFLLFLYTLFGSLFMLLAIIQVYLHLGATDFALLSVSEISLDSQKILWLKCLLKQQTADQQIIKFSSINPILCLTPTALLLCKGKGCTLLLPEAPEAPEAQNNQKLVKFGANLSSNIHYKPYNYGIKYLVELPFSLVPILTRSFTI